MKKTHIFVATCLLASSGLAFANSAEVCPNNLEFVNDSRWQCDTDNQWQISNCHKLASGKGKTAYITQIDKSGVSQKSYAIPVGEANTSIPQVIGDQYTLSSSPDGNVSEWIDVSGCSNKYFTHIYQGNNGKLYFTNEDPRDHK